MFQIQKDQVKLPLELFFHDRKSQRERVEASVKMRVKCLKYIYISRGRYEMRVKNQKNRQKRSQERERRKRVWQEGGSKGIKIMASNYVKCLIAFSPEIQIYIVNTQRERESPFECLCCVYTEYNNIPGVTTKGARQRHAVI